MDDEPKRGEGGGVFVGEDLGEVGLDVGGTGERGIVAQQVQMGSVGGEAPQRLVVLVQIILKCEGGGARAVGGEGGAAPVERLRRGNDDDRHTTDHRRYRRPRRMRRQGR